MEETQLPFELKSDTHPSFTPRKLKMEWRKLNFPSNSKWDSHIFYTQKTQNGMEETPSDTHTSFTPRKLKMEWRKLNFTSSSKCHLSIFYTPKTQDGMDETQLHSEFQVSFLHLLHPENSTSLRVQSVVHPSFTPRKLKMEWVKLNFTSSSKYRSYIFYTRKLKIEWMKLKFPSSSKYHSSIFYTPKTQDGTQLHFEFKVSFIHLLHSENSRWNGWNSTSLRVRGVIHTSFTPKTQDGMDETQLHFELKVSLIDLLHLENSRWNESLDPENSKWYGWDSSLLRLRSVTRASFLGKLKMKWMKAKVALELKRCFSCLIAVRGRVKVSLVRRKGLMMRVSGKSFIGEKSSVDEEKKC
jgi:hypothetical protein